MQEAEDIRGTTLAPEAETVGKIRRSQKPVPLFPGQLRLVAAGACIPAASKASPPPPSGWPYKHAFCQGLGVGGQCSPCKACFAVI